MRAWLGMIAGVLAGCPAPASQECDDGRFCPSHMVCGGTDLCLVEPGSCGLFPGRSPCLDSFGSGHCTDGACTPGVQVAGRIVEVPQRTELAGIEVRAVDHAEIPAVVSLIGGRFVLGGVPEQSEIVLSFAKTNYLPGLSRVLAIGDSDFTLDNDPVRGSYIMMAVPYVSFLANALGTPADPALGLISGQVWDKTGDTGLGGASVTIDPPCGVGPLYFQGDGSPDPVATTTSAGAPVFAYFNCPPGDYELSASHPTLTHCRVSMSEPTARLPVAAGTLSFAGRISCAE